MDANRFKITLHTSKGQFEELVTGESIELGRNISADLPVMASGVSRSHLNIYVRNGNVMLKDLGSTNGTYIKGVRVEPHREISYESGTRVSLGQAGCFVRIELVAPDVKIENPVNVREEVSYAQKKMPTDTQIRKSSEDTGIIEILFGKSKKSQDPNEKRNQKQAQVHMDQAGKLIKKRISEAEASIRKGIQKARIQAKDITNEARKEADIIKAKAQVEKNKMLSELEDEMSVKQSQILRDVHEQKINLEKVLADRHANLEAEVSVAKGQIKKDMREAEALVNGAKSEAELLIHKKTKLNDEIKDLLEKKNSARQEFKEIEVKLATIDEAHLIKSNALESELAFVKKEIEKNKSYLEDIQRENEKEKLAQKNKLASLIDQSEIMSKSLEQLSDDHSKISIENEDLSEQVEELNIRYKHKKIEFDDLKIEVEKLLHQRDELEDSIVQTREAEELRLHEYKEQVEIGARKVTTEAQRKADLIVSESEIKNEELLKDAKTILSDATVKADMIVRRATETEKDLIESREKLYNEAAESKKQIIEAAELEKKNILSGVTAEKEEILKEVKALKSEALSAKERILEAAYNEKEVFLKEAKEKFENAESDYNAKMSAFQDYKALEKQKLETEIKENSSRAKKSLERQLAELKVSGTRVIEKEIEEKKRILDIYRSDYAESWSTAIVFKAQEIFKNSFDQEESSAAREKLKNFAKAIINEQNPDEELEIQSLMKFDPALKEKKKKLFKRTAAFAALGLFALMLSPYISKSVKEKAQQIAKNSIEASKERVLKFEEDRNKLKTFVPPKRDEYLATYTDRVLYTTNYVENELSKEYREEWFLSLDTFFVEDLILSDETIVTFISKETNLIKDLRSMRENINAQFLDESIARMKTLEQKFIKDVKKLVKNESKFSKFESFKKRYYLKNFPFDGERSLATEE